MPVIDEELLLEKTRKELIDKSKTADIVKRYGTTRYERRHQQHVYNSISAFNKIDCNALFRANLLSFIIPVHGETDNYEVEILFEGICDDIKHQITANKNVLEYKCVYKALIDALNRQDIMVACTCSDWKYRQAYWANKQSYNGGRPEVRPSNLTNPKDTKGGGCKHVLNVLDNLDWALKLATSIYNYIRYMEDEHTSKFVNVIFPAIFSIPYSKYKDDQTTYVNGDDELANAMDDDEAELEIDKANERGEYKYNPDVEEPEEEEPKEDNEEEVDNG